MHLIFRFLRKRRSAPSRETAIYRQGDVLIHRIGEAGGVSPSRGVVTLAEGEVTGHSHCVYGGAALFSDEALARSFPDNAYVGTLDVPAAGAEVRHVLRDGSATGEHDTIALRPGRYVVEVQREYDPEGERRAQD